MLLVVVPLASAAGSITLVPTSALPGTSVQVTGTGFAATKSVGLGFGAEVAVTNEAHEVTNKSIGPDGDGVYGPFTVKTLHYPIKPGSFSFHCDVDGVTSDFGDTWSNGTLEILGAYGLKPFVNYVTGEFGRSGTTDWSTMTLITFTASYTYYQYNVTSAAGITTTSAGGFVANFTVPSVVNGVYNVTAIDSAGNRATATTLAVVPEGLTIGVVVLLSSVSAIVGLYYFRKRPKIASYGSIKL